MDLHLLLILSLALMAAGSVEKRGNQRLVDEHVQWLRNFTCKDPQIRVKLAQEVLTDFSFPPTFKFQPSCTVLRRCDMNSGCCRENQQCVPNLQQNRTLWFKVQEGNGPRKSKPKFVSVNVVEHLNCKCARREKEGEPSLSLGE